jgi:hypothetical protein
MRNLPLTLSCAVAIILASTTSLAKGSTSPSNIAEESQSLREGRTSPQQSHNLTLRQNQSSILRNTSDKVDSPQMVCSVTQATASSAPPAIYAAEQSVARQARYAATMSASRHTETSRQNQQARVQSPSLLRRPTTRSAKLLKCLRLRVLSQPQALRQDPPRVPGMPLRLPKLLQQQHRNRARRIQRRETIRGTPRKASVNQTRLP